MGIWYHPESDSLFEADDGEWLGSADGQLCAPASCSPDMVARYNRENPGYRTHLLAGPETCDCAKRDVVPGACPICDGGLAFCKICRAGECEITTDCPGSPASPEQREAVCRGDLDFWSGVWL